MQLYNHRSSTVRLLVCDTAVSHQLRCVQSRLLVCVCLQEVVKHIKQQTRQPRGQLRTTTPICYGATLELCSKTQRSALLSTATDSIITNTEPYKRHTHTHLMKCTRELIPAEFASSVMHTNTDEII